MLGMLRTNMGNVNVKNESNPICYIDFRYLFLDYIHVYVKVRNVRNVRCNLMLRINVRNVRDQCGEC